MNILFLADPNSIHDIKWMSYFSLKKEYNCFLVLRKHHHQMMSIAVEHQLKELNIQVLTPLPDFSITRFWITLSTAFNLLRIINKNRIDLFHIQYAEPNALWAIFKIIFNCKIILTTRGTDVLKTIPQFFKRKDLLALITQRLYRHAFRSLDAITSTSLSQQESIQQLFVVHNIQIIRTGINIDFIDDQLDLNNENHFDEYLFFPRSMTPLYNHELALEAIDLLPKKLSYKLRYLFVDATGNNNEYISFINEKIKRHRLKDRIVFLDRLDQEKMIKLTKFAKAIVMTPLSDGASVSAMETIYCGTPLILPPLNYDQDLFAGVIQFKERTKEALANTIINVLNNAYSIDDLKLLKFRIHSSCNRMTEMYKLEQLFKRLKN